MLENNCSKLNHSGLLIRNVCPKTLSCHVLWQPALVRWTAGQTCTKLVVANFVKFDVN